MTGKLKPYKTKKRMLNINTRFSLRILANQSVCTLTRSNKPGSGMNKSRVEILLNALSKLNTKEIEVLNNIALDAGEAIASLAIQLGLEQNTVADFREKF